MAAQVRVLGACRAGPGLLVFQKDCSGAAASARIQGGASNDSSSEQPLTFKENG